MGMELKITCIPGDGIGPEIINEAKKVLNQVGKKYGHQIQYTDILMGGASIDVHGVPLTDEAISVLAMPPATEPNNSLVSISSRMLSVRLMMRVEESITTYNSSSCVNEGRR